MTGRARLRVLAPGRSARLPRGALFLSAGDRAVDWGSYWPGRPREYFLLADGREGTRGFACPGNDVGSLSDLLAAQPARSSAVAEADTQVAVVAWRPRVVAQQR